MITRRLTLSFLLVIGTLISIFSQTSYPKKILWENDTVVAITRPQLVEINRTINDYIHLKNINKTLQRDIVLLDSMNAYWRETTVKMDSINIMEQTKFTDAMKMNKTLQKSLNSVKRKNKISIGVGIGGVLIGMLLGFLL